jgi:LytR cell envelope-related transcriptional attenuator
VKIDSRVRSGLTLMVLLSILGLGATWGWSTVSKPLPKAQAEPAGPCRTLNVTQGGKVRPQDVVVSVYNASERAGLAQRTLGQFIDDGFGEGEADNAPGNAGVENAEIWSANAEDPAVQLVASRLTGVEIIEGPQLGPGVVVLVGDEFPDDLAKGATFVTAQGNAEICAPVSPTS